MVRKAFEQDLHDKYDAPAKVAVEKYLERTCDVTVQPNPDKYGVDLLILKCDRLIGTAEVEVRQWSPNCPYPTIHVPERKTKFFGDRVLFFALTGDMQHAYWIETNKIKDYPIKEVRNFKVAEGEMFYDVPTSQFGFVDLT